LVTRASVSDFKSTKSAVDWTKFYQNCPAFQHDQYRLLKSKSDALVTKVNTLPESLPSIDWNYYKSKIPVPGLVDKFQKQYETYQVPMPKDTAKWDEFINEQETHAAGLYKRFYAASDAMKQTAEEMLATVDKLPSAEEMNCEMMCQYFPGSYINSENPIPPERFGVGGINKKQPNKRTMKQVFELH